MTTVDQTISGDLARQAVDSLRGYAYQIYASALTWINLKSDELLFLEVAEDYAVLASEALNGVQVKDTADSGSLTLNSPAVADTINSYFKLISLNPAREVRLRFLTTSPEGVERRLDDRIAGKSCLSYWRQASISANVQPLRERLLKLALSEEARTFIESASDETFREKLLKRIFWDCGNPPVAQLRDHLDEALVLHGEDRNVPSQTACRVNGKVIEKVLATAITDRSDARKLTRADFIKLFDEQTTLQLRHNQLSILSTSSSSIMPLTGGNENALSQTFSLSILEPLENAVIPHKIAPREVEATNASSILKTYQALWLHAGTGQGKTILAQLIFASANKTRMIARLRNFDADTTERALARLSAEILAKQPDHIIIDDLNHFELERVRSRLNNCLHSAAQTNANIAITSNREPSAQLLSTLNISSNASYEVGDLSEEETSNLIAAYGGDPKIWGRYVYLSSIGGHPQLAHAIVLGLSTRNWPISEFKELTALLGGDNEITKIRAEARRRLINELTSDQRQLLYRLSILIGRFEKTTAVEIAGYDPKIPLPGEVFETLVGPWIDKTGKNEFRISPLISNAGQEAFGTDELKILHANVARLYTRPPSIRGDRFDAILLHALIGKEEKVLNTIVTTALLTSVDELKKLASAASSFISFRTDQEIYADNPKTSIMLRVLQSVMTLADGKVDKFRAAWAAMEKEFEKYGTNDAFPPHIRLTAYGKALLNPGLIETQLNVAKLVLDLRDLSAETNITFSGQPPTEDISDDNPVRYIPLLFVFQLSNITSIKTLVDVFNQLKLLKHGDRDFLLQGFERPEFHKDLCIKSPWLHESKSEKFDHEAAATHYSALVKICLELRDTEFAIAATETVAIILDEYSQDQTRALDYLDWAIKEIGDYSALRRAKARVLFHKKAYADHLQLLKPVLEKDDSGIEIDRIYMHREAAISYAELENWEDSSRQFILAEQLAINSDSENIRIMAVGLLADAAVSNWKDGEVKIALHQFAQCLERLKNIDPQSGLRAAACRALIGHSILCVNRESKGLDEKENGLDFVMLPGMNSNPNPHQDIKERAVGALEIAWYLLAVADIECGGNNGIRELLTARIDDEHAVLSTELLIAHTEWHHSFKICDADLYYKNTITMVNAQACQKQNSERIRNQDLRNPIRGRIPKASKAEFEEQRAGMQINLFAFMAFAALSNNVDHANRIISLDTASASPLLTTNVLDSFSLRDIERIGDPTRSTAACVGTLLECLTQSRRPIVPDLFLIGLRVFELCKRTYFGEILAQPALIWLKSAWRTAIEKESFRFRNPEHARKLISLGLDALPDGVKGLGEIHLLIHDHVGANLPTDFLKALREA